ncbi:hypothetical protein GOP47_0012971 [Adiantum capillus-veneris]|uniref:Uncharacterized protein n=1 Tax=Adiantum capillus-veneris TaxID=13818 RepID=A0A9D4ZH13_ADICA|nr:hypothetical protein GOP47_0012971 [Adiantum capillus-veneris]
MGNCASGSLSRELEHHFSDEKEQETSTVVYSTIFRKEPLPPSHVELQSSHVHSCAPAFNPSSGGPLLANLDSVKQSFSKPMNLVLAAPREEDGIISSAQSPAPSPSKTKLAKKVSFAENLVQTPSSPGEARKHDSCISGEDMRSQREGLIIENLSSGSLVEEGKLSHNSTLKKEVGAGKVRVKVVISKKQLSELLLSSTSSVVAGKEVGHAFVQKMVAATLLPQLIAT